MWTRRELKRKGRRAFFRNFWAVVAMCFLLAFIGAEYAGSVEFIHRNDEASTNFDLVVEKAISSVEEAAKRTGQFFSVVRFEREGTEGFSFARAANQMAISVFNALTANHGWLIRLLTGGFFILAAALMLVFTFLVIHPVQVGARHFFLHNRLEKTTPLEMATLLHRESYFRIVSVMFFRWLYTLLWTLLLVVPGMVKSYEYLMIPYLLADNPGLSRSRAFALSREMMRGEKWRAFVLDVSFFFWNLLSAATLGIAGILYVNPYIACTQTELYAVLKQKLLDQGDTTTRELPMPQDGEVEG